MSQSNDGNWIEIFHSLPSWEHCFIVYKLAGSDTFTPNKTHELVDASYIRDGFRVYRLKANALEFFLSNGTKRGIQDNYGHNYHIDTPGRWVVMNPGECRRVGDADVALCKQAVERKNDKYIQLTFRADLWAQAYCHFMKNNEKNEDGSEKWTETPGYKMEKTDGGMWTITVEASTLKCALNDGGIHWDSNTNNTGTYFIGLPGKYKIGGGELSYLSPADKDFGVAADTPKTKLPAPQVKSTLHPQPSVTSAY